MITQLRARDDGIDPYFVEPRLHTSADPLRRAGGRPFQAALVPQWPAVVKALSRDQSDRFDRFADGLIEAAGASGMKALLFTSVRRAEGRTTVVLTLAHALLSKDVRAVVVDADLSGPMLAASLGLRIEIGLEEVVERNAPLSEALVPIGPGLDLLPLIAAPAHPRSFLSGAGWSCLLARLRREYDLVLLDGGPIFLGLSAAALHRFVDGAILVRNTELTSSASIERAREVLEAAGAPLLGMAETFVS